MPVSLHRFIRSAAGIAGFCLLGSAALAQQSTASGWSITPYIWASSTSVDLTVRDTNIGSGDISFSDLLDVLDGAFMIQVEGGQGRWSGFGDLTYLKTSDTVERTVFTIDTESKQLILDAAIAYWPAGVGSPLSLFGGLRYSGFDNTYDFRLTGTGALVTSQGSSKDYYDGLLGLRYRFDLADRWALLTHADASFGGSEGTYMLRAMLSWTVGKRKANRILLGYQYKQAEFKDGELRTDFTYQGPLAGFDFRF